MKSKRIAVFTINDYNNFGNRLQNYAVCKLLGNYGTVETIHTNFVWDTKRIVKYGIWKVGHIFFEKIFSFIICRIFHFLEFDKNIPFSKCDIFSTDSINRINDTYDYFIYGSDQIWNYEFEHEFAFRPVTPREKNFSLSASIGVSEIPDEQIEKYRNCFNDFREISVREEKAAELVKMISGKNAYVLVDPTLCILREQWEQLEKKPIYHPGDKYILLSFLGEISDKRKQSFEKLANSLQLNLLYINDSKWFSCVGPAEFLYLIHHSEMIITDSFHSCVFSFLYDKTFYVLEREDHWNNMNSRMAHFLSLFDLESQSLNEIESFSLNHDYREAYKKLEVQRELFSNYLDEILL